MPRRRTQSRSPEVAFSHLEKVFYPKSRFTKGDVIKYYLEIAPVLLPHLAQRPVTLKRFPGGIHGQFFYEKDAPGYTPDWVPTFPVPRREGGEPIRYILVNDARVLAWCANLGTIELHPFLHRAPAIASPTAIAFDLDPGEGADLRDCATVALRLRDLLGELKLEAHAKVSGSKGLQVYVPLNTPTTYAATQAFAKAAAELLHRKHPKLIVSEMAKELRRGRVFIDWSQNSDFKTTVGVYSLRAKHEEPFVSMPVTWEEVVAAKTKRGAGALSFSPVAALKRVDQVGDLFAPVLKRRQELPAEFSEAVAERPARTPPALRAYEEKRNFGVTSEPAPTPRRSAQGSRRRFVVQKHAASHLHYDLRLEMHETLKSWAVPKGLPYAADEHHSAFATEDHPLDYMMFEGIIPQGEYGGGTVMVWDAGAYDVIDGNYWKGYLRVWLRGKKLKGEWTLNRVEESEGKPRWLITKSGKPMKPISARRDDQSALSGRSMAQIAAAADAVWTEGGERRKAEERKIGKAENRNGTQNAERGMRKAEEGRKENRQLRTSDVQHRTSNVEVGASEQETGRQESTRGKPRGTQTKRGKRKGNADRGTIGADRDQKAEGGRRRPPGTRSGKVGRGVPAEPRRRTPRARVRGNRQTRLTDGGAPNQKQRRAAPAPEFVEPMMARAVAALPEGDDWIYEVKWDGYRALALKHRDSVRLLSRKGNRLDSDFPGVVEAIRGIKADTALLDGEIVALDPGGRPQFQLLQNRASARGLEIVYYAYDLLQWDADDLRVEPLAARKARLAEVIAGTAVRFSADLPGRPEEILAQASRLGLEGIVAKRRSGGYEPGERSGSWLKLKLNPEQEFVIGGYRPGKPLDLVLVGYYEGGRLMFAGKVRQGLNPRNRIDLWRALEPLRTEDCPFANVPNSKKSHFGEGVTPQEMKELRWVQPRLVAQVSFTEWTRSGNLRHATYLGLREDKAAREVRREQLARA